MKFMQRISRGTEAGLIAGTAVALVFFVSDLVHLTPLAPPAALANALMADPPAGVDLPMAASMTGAVVLAAGVVVYSAFHFAAFAVLGVVAAFLLPGRPWTHMLGGGAVFGVVACTAVFFGTRLVVGSPFAVDNLSLSTLVLTNAAAGLAIGLMLYVHEAADRHAEAEPA
ncbi:MAG: hypothetical protein O2992_01805 [Gemmatimonadetes bacterium]|nr:hypothetical protein [Gemmatimonadota bacterium]